MSKFKQGLWKGICVAVAVPALMALALPVRALMLDGAAEPKVVASPDTAVVKGTVTSFGSVPLPDVTVTGTDESGAVIAMATTDANGQYAMEVPASAGTVMVAPEGGEAAAAPVIAGAATELDGAVPASSVVGDASGAGWWAGLGATSKAAIIAVPAVAVAGAGVAIANANESSARAASPVAP